MLDSVMAPRFRCRVLLAVMVVLLAACATTLAHTMPAGPAGCGLQGPEIGRLAGLAPDLLDAPVGLTALPPAPSGRWIGSFGGSSELPRTPPAPPPAPRAPPLILSPST
jgi:hypothetical protein